jgi:hypothetical protein
VRNKPAETPTEPAETAAPETPAETEAPVTEPVTEAAPTEPEAGPAADEPTAITEEFPDDSNEKPVTDMGQVPDEAPEETRVAPEVAVPAEPIVDDEPPTADTQSTIGETPPVTEDDETLNESILQDIEEKARAEEKIRKKPTGYVPPPSYDYPGRGLVYNCVGKHWACVDGPTYQTCEDNAASVQQMGRKVECHPFNVYQTDRGCEIMQNRVVSASAKTDFCK